jgi:signal transduction histidine kinase/ActR/RegA family two-component response regulator
VFPVSADTVADLPALVIDGRTDHYELGRQTLIAIGADAEQVPKSGWSRSDSDFLNLGFTDKVHWLSTSFSVPAGVASRTWFYHMDSGNLRDVNFQHLVDGVVVHRESAGTLHAFADRSIAYRELTFPVDMRPGHHQILLSVSSFSSISARLELTGPMHWFIEVSVEQLLLGGILGITGVLALYNLCIFFVVRERVYLYFFGALVAALCWRAAEAGVASQFIYPSDPTWHAVFVRVSAGLYVALLALFTRDYLRVEKWAPWLSTILVVDAVIICALLVIPIFRYFPAIGLLAILSAPLLCLLSASLAIRRGLPGSASFLTGMLIFFVGLLALIGRMQGWLPFNLVTHLSGELAVMGLAIVTSVGLANRISEEILKKDLALSAAQAKSEFLANMSHEIRTPLNAVVGFSELLRRMPLEDDEKSYVQRIDSASKNLLGIINDVLDYSKIEAGKMTLESTPLNITYLFDEMDAMFAERARAQSVSLSFSVDPGIPKNLLGDNLRLVQVLTNLIGNALKFTAEGGVQVRANLSNNEACNNAEVAVVLFEVADSGIGMSKEEQNKLFTPFTQADSSTTRNFGGTGLGLAICKQLVELMKGTIGLTSKPGQGSTFSFQVPFNVTTIVSTKLAEVIQDSDLSGIAVLLVEDNATNQILARTMLKKCGASCTIANNGQEALDYLSKHDVDVVLMDCQMPVLDGYQATQAIRKRMRLQNLPVIAMTASALQGDKERCIEAGMNDYISKPVRLANLSAIVKKWAGFVSETTTAA